MITRKEYFTYSLALIIISAYIVFFATVMFQAPSRSVDDLKTITATFGTIVAAAVGYYFGQRPAEQATKLAQESRGKRQGEVGDVINETTGDFNYWKESQEYANSLNSIWGEQ